MRIGIVTSENRMYPFQIDLIIDLGDSWLTAKQKACRMRRKSQSPSVQPVKALLKCPLFALVQAPDRQDRGALCRRGKKRPGISARPLRFVLFEDYGVTTR